MLGEIIQILLNFSSEIGYLGIVILMTIESSFIPFPSEIVVPPAAYLASQGQFNVYLVILSGIVGSLIGALINYFLARTLGRTIVYSLINKKVARLLLLNQEKLERAEKYFRKYGAISTFIGRLIPAIRQLISIPAGFSKMKLGKFLFYTALGSGLWTIVLAVFGYVFGANQDIWMQYYDDFKHIIYFVFGLFVLLVFGYWIILIIKKQKFKNPNDKN